METIAWFAEHGVLVAPGDFYGVRGARHVRVALTASDERVEAAATRIAG
jgi:aspartate/methionine/tyrosine aminotransferase